MPLALLFSGVEKGRYDARRSGERSSGDRKAADSKSLEKLYGLPGLRLVRPTLCVSELQQSAASSSADARRSVGMLKGMRRGNQGRSNSELAARHLVRPAARSIEPNTASNSGNTDRTLASQKRRFGARSGIASSVSKLAADAQVCGGRRAYVADYLKRKGVLEQTETRVEALELPGNTPSRRKGLVEVILNAASPEEAKRSLSYLDRLFSYFALMADVPGQQKTLLLALAARNRARRSGMSSEADLFDRWLEANS